MKIKHIWSVLAKESVINQDDNLISIYGVLEELKVDVEPHTDNLPVPEKIAIPLNYEIISLWLKEKKEEPAKAELEFLLLSPDGKELSKITHTMGMPVNMKRFRSRMKISGFPITVAGDYTFEVRIREEGEEEFKLVSKLPLDVNVNLLSPKK